VLYGLAGSALVTAAQDAGLQAASEVFADRSYQRDGSLTPRGQAGAMIEDLDASVTQVLRMVRDGVVRSADGHDVAVRADTLCLHGDQPGAAAFAAAIRKALDAAGITVRAPAVPQGHSRPDGPDPGRSSD